MMNTHHRHYDHRGRQYYGRVTSVSAVPSPFRNKTSGIGQEGNNAG